MSVSKVVQYPPQSGAYKVLVKDKGVWQGHSIARLQISVGNPKHEGDKFHALVGWAASRFDHVVFIVSDSLQRHNIALHQGLDGDDAYKISQEQGDIWLLQNRQAISQAPSMTLTRWDEWLAHPEYAKAYESLMNLYNSAPVLRDAVQAKALEFSQKYISADANVAYVDRVVATSVTYILEEVAAFALMFRDKAVDVYPGPWFKEIFDVIAGIDRSDIFAGFKEAQCLRVDFVRNKSHASAMPERCAA